MTVQQGNDASRRAAATEERAFGFNALSLPNLFATLFNRDKQAEVVALASNLKQNLTADLLNMKEQTFDFLRNSGHLQGMATCMSPLATTTSTGETARIWGLPRRQQQLLGWPRRRCLLRHRDLQHLHRRCRSGHRIMMGRENMMFGGQGDDVAVLAGRVNRAFMGRATIRPSSSEKRA